MHHPVPIQTCSLSLVVLSQSPVLHRLTLGVGYSMGKLRAGTFVIEEDWASKTIKASREVIHCTDEDTEA